MNANEKKMFDEIQQVIYGYDEDYANAVSEGVFENLGEFNFDDRDELEEKVGKWVYGDFAANINPYDGYFELIEGLGSEYVEFYDEHEDEFDCRSGGNAYNPLDESFAEETFDSIWEGLMECVPPIGNDKIKELVSYCSLWKYVEILDYATDEIIETKIYDPGKLIGFQYGEWMVVKCEEGYDGESDFIKLYVRKTNENEESNIDADMVATLVSAFEKKDEDNCAA